MYYCNSFECQYPLISLICHTRLTIPTNIILMIFFILTLLDNCFSCDVGDWEHSIKYVTGEEIEAKRKRKLGREEKRVETIKTPMFVVTLNTHFLIC